MTGSRFEIDPALPENERTALAGLAERLERDRPLPAPGFRGELWRRLVERPRPAAFGPWPGSWDGGSATPRWRVTALSYAAAGLGCLAVAAAGLAGAGPFAA